MKHSLMVFASLMLASPASSQSYSHNYERFFGKDDRIGLYSEAAKERFTETVLKTIRNNTLLLDCGTQGKPSTAFVAKTKNGPRIFSAAHNLRMAKDDDRYCKLGKSILSKGQASEAFKNNGMLDDAAHDIAQWPNTTSHQGFNVCSTINTSSKYFLAQSLDGTGHLGLSPFCKIRSREGNLIRTTCRGHYKASGAPLLKITDDNVCVAGVFNSHTGKMFNYESYAAHLKP